MTRMALILSITLAGTMSVFAFHKETVRQELTNSQKEQGLSLTWYEWGIRTLMFADGSESLEKLPRPLAEAQQGILSPDGKKVAVVLRTASGRPYLAIAHRNGTGIREYPEIAASGTMCWSPDKNKLAIAGEKANGKSSELRILDLDSKIALPVSDNAQVSSQCWSPHGNHIVYQVGKTIRIYGLPASEGRQIATGDSPSWSPDGNWIAFLERNTYYAVRSSGAGKKVLFRKENASSPLWWSPDSRIVAYVTWKVGSGVPRLWVRRLEDGSEYQVAIRPDVPYLPSYEWLTSVTR